MIKAFELCKSIFLLIWRFFFFFFFFTTLLQFNSKDKRRGNLNPKRFTQYFLKEKSFFLPLILSSSQAEDLSSYLSRLIAK